MNEPLRGARRAPLFRRIHGRVASISAMAALLALSTGCAFRPSPYRPIGPPSGQGAGSPFVTQPAPPLGAGAAAPDPEDPADGGRAAREPSSEALRTEAWRVLDDWHRAAAVGARNRYLDAFTLDAVFMGTDATERWDFATFSAYVDEHFRPGHGWTYTPSNRHVTLSPDRSVAWFDEALDSDGYGALRGTGVLRRDRDSWKIAHYSMTFTIPNDVAREVVDVVRSAPGTSESGE